MISSFVTSTLYAFGFSFFQFAFFSVTSGNTSREKERNASYEEQRRDAYNAVNQRLLSMLEYKKEIEEKSKTVRDNYEDRKITYKDYTNQLGNLKKDMKARLGFGQKNDPS